MNKLILPVSDRDHIQGNKNASLTFVMYGDYESVECAVTYLIVKQLQTELGDTMRFVFRHFPVVKIHPNAQQAARVAEAAGNQKSFWQMHEMLFENQSDLDEEHLMEYVDKLDLDPIEIIEDATSENINIKIQQDTISGVKSGVTTTPTFFINDILYEGSFSFESLRTALRNAIAKIS